MEEPEIYRKCVYGGPTINYMRIFHCAVKGSTGVCVCVCVCVFTNHEKLAHSTVDTEKSHDLQAGDPEKPGV